MSTRRGSSWLRPCAIAVLALGALAGTAAPAASQIAYGGVVGVANDAQGGVLPGANVRLTNRGTGLERETVTDAKGAYNFVNVLPGSYDVAVTLQGFREAVRTAVPVTVGQISRVDVTLEIGAMNETVTVQSEAELLQTDKADVKTELTATAMTNLPLNGYRNVQSLIVLVPGSLPPTFQNAETDTPQRSLNMNVNGLGGAANTTLTDGTRSTNVAMPYHEQYIQPVETIDTVTVTTGSMDAETGMAGGAAITVTTKSGTNVFRGSAFEYFNNQDLNATPYYFGTGAPPVKLPVQRQTAGGTLGGPLLRNRLFFFGSYEGYFSSTSQYAFYTVPDAALRTGDFSHALNADGSLQRIYDPFTGDPSTGMGRVAFPGNVIPSDLIDPIAGQLVQMYPLPNVEGTGAGQLTNNYRTQQVSTTARHNIDVKVNWNRTSSHQIWSKFSEMHAVVDNIFTFPFTDDVGGGPTVVKELTAGQTWSLTPTLLVDSSFGYMDSNQAIQSVDVLQGNLGLGLGIPGTNDQGANDTRYAGLPSFATGFTALGNTPNYWPEWMYQNAVTFGTNVTKVSGSHEFKGGYLLSYMQDNNWQPEGANPRGSFNFATNATRTFGAGSQTGNFYNQYAAFLLGLVGTAGKSDQNEIFTTREFQHAMYFRDRWTAGTRLTLDLGLRWEYYPMMGRADRGLEMLDLQTLNVRIGGEGGNPRDLDLTAPKNAFAPRLGAVYRLNEDTVLRSGYGLTYDARGMGAQEAFKGLNVYPLAINGSFQTPPSQSTFGWYGTLAQGIPLLVGPDVSSGEIPLPNSVGMQTPIPASTERGKTHSWNVSVERRLPLVSVDVAYVGNRQVGGLTAVNINPVLNLGAGAADRPYVITNGRSLAVNVFMPYTKTTYHALQLAVSRPLSRGLMLQGHYTYAHAWALGTSYSLPSDAAQTYDFATLGIPADAVAMLSPGPDATARNWTPASGSRRHVLTMSAVYQLPWQSGSDKSTLLQTLYRDWQVNGIFTAFSGAPFTVTADGTSLNTPGNTQTADLIGNVTTLGQIGADGFYFDPSAWGQPTCVCFGNTAVNEFTGPGGWNLDFSIFRTIRVTDRQRLELRIEATNVTDTPKFANPTSSLTSGNFMRVLSTNNAFTERNVRLALRYTF
jgi:hypothetical protein